MKKIIARIIFILALICFCFSAFSLIRYGLQTLKTREGIRELANQVNHDIPVNIKDAGESDVSDPEKAAEAAKDDAAAMMAKYGKLYEQNQDFIGWLTVEDTPIDLPVMYTPADPEHYLRKNFYGDYDIGGMLFIDARCTLDPEDHVSTDTIIYGHRMKNATMFGPLKDFKDPDYCEAHTTVYFDTLYRPGTYRVFAAFLSRAYDDDSDAFKYYDFIEAENAAEFDAYLTNIQALSHWYDAENAPVFGDELITLSTCDYYTDDGRLAIVAKRID